MLDGGGDADTLNGGEGNDTLTGGDGGTAIPGDTVGLHLRDVLDGGEGNDSLSGGAGGDVLNGGIGADTLVGGVGNDTLSGGAGADRFVFSTGEHNNTIRDFSDGQTSGDADLGAADDRIDLSAFSAITTTDISYQPDGTPEEIHVTWNVATRDVIVTVDSDLDGTPEVIITLENYMELNGGRDGMGIIADDFILA